MLCRQSKQHPYLVDTNQRAQRDQRDRSLDFEELARDFWATKPTRPRHGRYIAGVAAGIGQRYDIDPVLIRVILVLTTFFGGAGPLAYFLGWLVLANEKETGSPLDAVLHRGRSSVSPGFTLLLCVGLLLSLGLIFRGPFGGTFSGLFSLIVLGGGLMLLHYARGGSQPPNTTAAPATAPAADTASDSLEASADREPAADQQLLTTPSAPIHPTPPPYRPKSKVGPITFALALIAGALCIVLASTVGGWFTAAHSLGIIAGVLGIGLIIGAFLYGGRGLIIPALLVSILAVGFAAVPAHGWHNAGRLAEAPASVAEVRPLYQLSAGAAHLDLTRITLAKNETVSTAVEVGVGGIQVLVPRDVTVDASCHTNVGVLRCLGVREDGAPEDAIVTDQPPHDQGVGTIHLTLNAGIGSIEVTRD